MDQDGAITNFLGMHRDISVIHQLEQQLKHQKLLSETMLDLAPAMVVLLNSEQQVLLDNQAYKNLKKEFNEIEPVQLFLQALNGRLDNFPYVGFHDVQVSIETLKGCEYWFVVSGIHLEELDDAGENYFKASVENGHYLLLVATDITSRKVEAERARIQQLKVQMAEQELTQSIRENLSGAIFQLETPINVIQAALAMPPSSPEMLYPFLF